MWYMYLVQTTGLALLDIHRTLLLEKSVVVSESHCPQNIRRSIAVNVSMIILTGIKQAVVNGKCSKLVPKRRLSSSIQLQRQESLLS